MSVDLTNINSQNLRDMVNAFYNHCLNHLMGDPVVAPGSDDTKFAVSAFHYMLAGVAEAKAAADDIAAPGASTSSGEFRKILLSINAAGTITATAGAVAASQALAELPSTPTGELPIGYLELPASFTSGSTSLTTGMCKQWTHEIDLTP